MTKEELAEKIAGDAGISKKVERYINHYTESLRGEIEVLDKVYEEPRTNLAQSTK